MSVRALSVLAKPLKARHSPPLNRRLFGLITFAAFLLGFSQTSHSRTFSIVAIGASNTSGWGVPVRSAYPAQLESMLRARGYNVFITNSGVPFHTTSDMLRRVQSVVPNGTDLVILQPGGNDLRFFGTPQKRASNIRSIVEALGKRKIPVIVYDPVIPANHYRWDRIHLTIEGHRYFALELLPQVVAAIEQRENKPPSTH